MFLLSVSVNAQVAITLNNAPIGTASILDFESGAGSLISATLNGHSVSINVSADSAYLATQSQVQSGAIKLCVSGTGTTKYACTLQPTLNFYTKGMVVNLIVDTLATSGIPPSLNIDRVGPVTITQVDGITPPTDMDLIPGQMYPIWYDGLVFRLFTQSNILVAPSRIRPTCDRAHSGRWVQFQGNANVKDSVSICVKAANNGFFWKYVY